MADTKISALTALTGAGTASDDLLVIVDTGATQTKKITVAEFQAAPISAGTANGILYLNGSKVASSGSALTFDGATVALNASTGVGIKVVSTSTQANLRLGSTFTSGTSGENTDWALIQSFSAYGDLVLRSGTAEGVDPRLSGTTRWQVLRDGTSIWSVGGSEAMRLTSTGLGIGTSSPSERLDVFGKIQSRNAAAINDAVVGALNFYNTNAAVSANPVRASIVSGRQPNDWGAYLDFYTSSGTAAQASNMRLDASGNLGLGVTPSYKLHVGGAIGFAPGASVAPVSNGDVVIEATNNTTLTFKLRGSDGTTRSASLTLA